MTRVVLVAGAPRSGTSVVSHFVSELGYSFGDAGRFVDPTTHGWNPVFFELLALNEANDRIAAALGLSYDSYDALPDFTATRDSIAAEYVEVVGNLIQSEFGAATRVGLKDPRFCITLPVWLKILKMLGCEASVIYCKRDAESVRQSNQLLAGIRPQRARRLAMLSPLLLSRALHGVEHFSIQYGEFVENPRRVGGLLAHWLDAPQTLVDTAAKIVDPQLRHHTPNRTAANRLPTEVSGVVPEKKGPGSDVFWEACQFLETYGFAHAVSEEHAHSMSRFADVQSKDQHIAGLNEAIQHKDRYIAGLQHQLEEAQAQQDALRSRLLAARNATAQLKRAKRRLAVTLKARLATCNRLQSQLEEERINASKIQGDLYRKEKELALAEKTITQEQEKLRQTIRQQDVLLDQFSLSAANSREAEQNAIDAMSQKDQHIAGLHEAVAAKDAYISGLLSQIAALENKKSGFQSLSRLGKHFARRVNATRRQLRPTFVRVAYKLYHRCGKFIPPVRHLARWAKRKGLITTAELQFAEFIETLPPPSVSAGVEIRKPFSEATSVTAVNYPIGLCAPLNVRYDHSLIRDACLNVLLPSLNMKDMSGGPNTALLLASQLVEKGHHIRFISTNEPVRTDQEQILRHIERLHRRRLPRAMMTFVDGSNRSHPIAVGKQDTWLATAWWTAQMARRAAVQGGQPTFVYLIQDFEPILHDASTLQALALETYSFDHVPVVNTAILRDHLASTRCGLFSDSSFVQRSFVFEPAIDRSYFFPLSRSQRDATAPRTLLFYARPTIAKRNLFELGLLALRDAVGRGLIDEDWQVLGIGEYFDRIPLGRDVWLEPSPWLMFSEYAESMRNADLLLSLMMSPHPSYPPLEMAATGNLVVTNSCSVKTRQRMQEISPNILVGEATPTGISDELAKAVTRVNSGLRGLDSTGEIGLPSQWDESFSAISQPLSELVQALSDSKSRPCVIPIATQTARPDSDYETYRVQRYTSRRYSLGNPQPRVPLSLATTVWNTKPEYLDALANTVLSQVGNIEYEWLILDNGSTCEVTIKAIEALACHSAVRHIRVEKNVGIVGGMRTCLECAANHYFLPIDSDDLLEPDALKTIADALVTNGNPACLYTDEDKILDSSYLLPYYKPDWDPVLFSNSCYIAHLCCFSRELALRYNCYTDTAAEGCHDWDTFFRFIRNGHVPLHIPDVLYTWRMHPGSTSGNIESKEYIAASQLSVLNKWLDTKGRSHIKVESSPLFSAGVDWRCRRSRKQLAECLTVNLSLSGEPENPMVARKSGPSVSAIDQLIPLVEATRANFIHFQSSGCDPRDADWLSEAQGVCELFPDTVIVGGPVVSNDILLTGPLVFGFGNGHGSPLAGLAESDPGYFALAKKLHSVDAVSVAHCVVRREFLQLALRGIGDAITELPVLGLWLCAIAQDLNLRVVYSPFLMAEAGETPEARINACDRSRFLSRFWHLMGRSRFYSSRLSLRSESGYRLALESERAHHMRSLQQQLPAYVDWFEDNAAHCKPPIQPIDDSITVSIVTPVYQGSDLTLLEQLAQSIHSQTRPACEWLIVINGPMNAPDIDRLQGKAGAWNATIEIIEDAGIIRALKHALDIVSGTYLIVVDGDDLVTADAVAAVSAKATAEGRPDLLFSDEDTLDQGDHVSPFLRGEFDEILNTDASYIWHLIAVKTETARAVNAYSDGDAEWCQDWDIVSRIAAHGGTLSHISDVLYHWRCHAASTTNNKVGDERSLLSVRHILQRRIDSAQLGDRLSVQYWPMNRGVPELYIAYTGNQLPPVRTVVEFPEAVANHAVSDDSLWVATVECRIANPAEVYAEAARLFLLHPRLAVIGGVVADGDGIIQEACGLRNAEGGIESPWVDMNVSDPGPYALAMKPQSVGAISPSLAVFRGAALLALNESLHKDMSELRSWVTEASQSLGQSGWLLCFSPLVRATATRRFQTDSHLRFEAYPGNGGTVHALARYGKTLPHVGFWGGGR